MFEKVLGIIERLYVLMNSSFEEKGKVLMFHHITDEDVDTLDCCKCKVQRFIDIINDVQKEYNIISIERIYSEHKDKFAVITFDDGCMDMYLNAYPYLKAHNIPFTVYLTSDFIGQEGYVGIKEVKKLANDTLVTIGFHTKSHPLLRKVQNLHEEMWSNKKCIENLVGHELLHFAFPYGKLQAVGLKAVIYGKHLHYTTIMSTFDTYLSLFSLRFKWFLPRTVIM